MNRTERKERPKAADFRAMAREALKGKWKKGWLLFLLSQFLIGGMGLTLVKEHFGVADSSLLSLIDMGDTRTMTGFGWFLWAVLLVWSLVNGFLYVGMQRMCICALDGGELRLKDLSPTGLFGRAALMGGLRTVLQAVPQLLASLCIVVLTSKIGSWSTRDLLQLLLYSLQLAAVVPAIVLGMGLKMADYLMAKDEPIGPIAALKASWRKMRGWKWRYFCLCMSFIGWVLLAMFPGRLFERWVPIGNALMKDALVWLINLAASGILTLYMTVATAAFFRHVDSAEEEAPEQPEAE